MLAPDYRRTLISQRRAAVPNTSGKGFSYVCALRAVSRPVNDHHYNVPATTAAGSRVLSIAKYGIVPLSAIEASDKGRLAVIELIEPWSQPDLRVCVQRNPNEKNVFRDRLVEILSDRSEDRHPSAMASQ